MDTLDTPLDPPLHRVPIANLHLGITESKLSVD